MSPPVVPDHAAGSPARWVWAVLVAVVGTAMATARWVSGDWDLFESASRSLLGSSGLRVYVDQPNIQSGPLSLLAVGLLDHVGQAGVRVVLALLAVVTLACLAVASGGRARTSTFLVGGVVVALWWPYFATSGHLDDALVITMAAASLALVRTRRADGAAVLLGLSIAVKPWAVALLPLAWCGGGAPRDRLRRPLTSLAVGALMWSPFLLAAPATVETLRPTVRLAPDSVLRLVGSDWSHSPSLRIAQLALALLAASVVAWRGRPGGVALAAIAVRMAMDPGTWSYYTTGLIVAALAWDLCESRGRLPWMTLSASVLLHPAWAAVAPQLQALVRLLACLVALGVVLWPDRRPAVAPTPVAGERRRPLRAAAI